MAPAARWIFAALAACVLWFGLGSVPVRVSYFGSDGQTVYRDWRRCGDVAAWEEPMSDSVREVSNQRSQDEYRDVGAVRLRLKEARPVAYKRWDAWLCGMAFAWVLLCGLLWPFLWLLRRRPGWLLASRFSLACLALGLVGALLGGMGGGPEGIHTTLILPCMAVLMGRPLAAPEGGAPWFGMVAGVRAFGASLLMLPLAFFILMALSVGRFTIAGAFGAILVGVLGIGIVLCLSPAGQLRAWARHFTVVVLALLALLPLTELLQWANAILSPEGAFRPRDYGNETLGGFLAGLIFAGLIWVVIVLAASGLVALYRRLSGANAT